MVVSRGIVRRESVESSETRDGRGLDELKQAIAEYHEASWRSIGTLMRPPFGPRRFLANRVRQERPGRQRGPDARRAAEGGSPLRRSRWNRRADGQAQGARAANAILDVAARGAARNGSLARGNRRSTAVLSGRAHRGRAPARNPTSLGFGRVRFAQSVSQAATPGSPGALSILVGSVGSRPTDLRFAPVWRAQREKPER